MPSQVIEAEADRIINIMTRLESLKLLERCPASTADCKGNVSQNISPSGPITERPQGICEQNPSGYLLAGWPFP